MKKYTILIISFIISGVLFSILIYTEKSIVNKNELEKVYILSQDIKPYTKITKDMYDIFYVSKNDINKYSYINDENILSNKISVKSFSKGIILSDDILINEGDKQKYITENKKEIVLVKIDNNDKMIGKLLNENNYINLYITVKSNYLPNNINNLRKVEFKSEKVDQITFLYLEKFRTYSIIYEDEVTKNNLSSIVLELDQEQATYINSIKDIADFSISII